MEEILERINQNITDYNNIDNELVFEDTQKLSSILKNLSSNLFYLESYRNHYHTEYNAIMHKAIKQNTPVSKSEIEAKEQVPELYMLRRLMTSAYKITDSIRTNISYLKSEKKC